MNRHGTYYLRDSHLPCSPFQKWGKFGRLFPTLPAHEPDQDDLVALGVMEGPLDEGSGDLQPDSRTIPAGFTFFGQFIDHDITLDPTSSLERQNDPTAIRNFRTPLLELDCVYGSGPGANPHLYDQNDPDKLLIGTPENANDLPRNRQGTALIGDPRNDENLIISQLQLAFLKFHNAAVDYVRDRTTAPNKVFEEAQRLVRWHYQWIIVNEFLPLIIGPFLVDEILRDGLRFYYPGSSPFIPIEFSAAAYRFGHSQVRAAYRINEETTRELFDLPFFAPVPPDQVIDWTNFFHISSSNPPQYSRRIDARLVHTLLDLKPPIVPPGVPPERRSLAVRNLQRGASFSLPAGQTVARAMGITPLTDEALELATLYFPGKGFSGEAPLWYYILKEAEVQTEGETLGQVGGRIVGEVLLGLLQADPMSYFNLEPRWQPDPAIAPNGRLTDLLNFAGVLNGPPEPASGPVLAQRVGNGFAQPETTSDVRVVSTRTGVEASAPAFSTAFDGELRLREMEIVTAEASGATPHLLRHDQPFDVRLVLDLSQVAVPDDMRLNYTAAIHARRLDGDGARQVIGTAQGTLTETDTFVITMPNRTLPTGLHRLEAAVTVVALSPAGPDLAAHLEGNLLQVQ